MTVIYVCFLKFLIQVPTVNQENETFGTEPTETKVSKQKSTLCCLKRRIYNTSFHLFCHFCQIISYHSTVWLVRLIYIISCCWQSLCSQFSYHKVSYPHQVRLWLMTSSILSWFWVGVLAFSAYIEYVVLTMFTIAFIKWLPLQKVFFVVLSGYYIATILL
jgi:hypothetical protein